MKGDRAFVGNILKPAEAQTQSAFFGTGIYSCGDEPFSIYGL
jgi:hypothetical protein